MRRLVGSPKASTFKSEQIIIVGNVAFYGATSGEAFVSGVAGERFCVRNSGATVVVEGVGDHGCEYMTGGRVVVIGPTGRNFGAGMSGGIAYVFDPNGTFPSLVNTEMVDVEGLGDDERTFVHELLRRHHDLTGSPVAVHLLEAWTMESSAFRKVMPRDYRRVLEQIRAAEAEGLGEEETLDRVMAASRG